MLSRARRVHFVGIGGIGMCALAELLHARGHEVSGSDLRDGPTLARLRALGVRVHVGHDPAHVDDADVVVFSSAVRPDNPERAEARRRGIPAVGRGEMLAESMRFRRGIAVAGSHGKTTTSALVTHVLAAAGLDPTAVVGGRVPPTAVAGGRVPRATGGASGTRVGRGDWMVVETDESDGSFLRLAPIVAVVTSIDPEHLDHWGSLEAARDGFVAFVNRVPFWGCAVLCADHPGVRAILPRVERRRVTYGAEPASRGSAPAGDVDLVGVDLATDGPGTRFAVRAEGKPLGAARMPLPGRHNVANALAALAVARELDVPFDVFADALSSFPGVERRYQVLGEARGVRVVDDYGHHPEEIRATLAAARAHVERGGRCVAVFQPHRYTRTRDLLDGFADAFADADLVVVTEVYAAGEDPIPGADGATLARAVRGGRAAGEVRFEPGLETLPGTLAPLLRPGDLVLTLGAGSITSLGPRLLRALEERP